MFDINSMIYCNLPDLNKLCFLHFGNFVDHSNLFDSGTNECLFERNLVVEDNIQKGKIGNNSIEKNGYYSMKIDAKHSILITD